MIKLSPLDMNYGSTTFPGLITPTAVWPGLWYEAPEGANSAHSQQNPEPQAPAFIHCGSRGYFCGGEILSL